MTNRYHEEVVWGRVENPATEGYAERFHPTKRDLEKELHNLEAAITDVKNSMERVDKVLAECKEILGDR